MRPYFRFLNKSATQWFPGHMAKGLRRMQAAMRKISCVIEVHDARLPFTGRNQRFSEFSDAPRLLILNKADLAEPALEQRVAAQLQAEDSSARVLYTTSDATRKKQLRNIDQVVKHIVQLLPMEALLPNGQQEINIKLMIAGMPNVGKSSLVNALRQTYYNKAKCARTGPMPGVTRAVQTAIRIHDEPGITILDTPGIMIPNLEHPDDAMKLAAIGTMKDELVGEEYVADYILYMLNRRECFDYVEKYGLDGPSDDVMHVLEGVGRRIGALGPGGVPQIHNASRHWIASFRGGQLGRFVLDAYKLKDD